MAAAILSAANLGAAAHAPRSAGKGVDAITLLKADHRTVEKLFAQFDKARGDARRKALADRICHDLRLHMQIEEEIFYPASRLYLQDQDIVDEAVVEHAAARDLIDEIEAMAPGEELYDAKVTVLCEQIDHHVEEEEADYFPGVRKTGMDLNALGARLQARKNELMAETRPNRTTPVH
ncbi:MAG TPA: hemerythrin domain-containing protein [Phenylobacterium sp.]|uniref:hemerythrin domain-containing protein n=1 Tax=Phenylobacterium sp. TaxID=1871053 RepID=UPI002D4F8396|nr:hemerythrin domain-containing protein [Phenylobacterium sp.]HZZ66660.1 hemerythrin domain-containing protein [Phenylobacterium sp.]